MIMMILYANAADVNIAMMLKDVALQTSCLPCAEMTTLNWNVALTGDVK